ncbi:D-sedoheptulose-7-phosphate isomerase [Microlunatus antarcticus]|uniref:D-sedoheptulose 7-phosphate isomerase n=1 Tax=Microlunatus antarcticus TaxID=53388 RepID=A0A7W5P5W9_9ACTN|nr:SIS domain-containing protein [Microlunatus antarcticus]MBB3325221.1 D-sedoheptulose 7-phosphate isomerase [Microlunatus antarcticus]
MSLDTTVSPPSARATEPVPPVRASDRLALVTDHLAALAEAAGRAGAYAATVSAWGAELARRYDAGAHLIACGNGGSAAEAQHLTGELVGRFRHDRRPLPAVALSADSAAHTAIANDYGFDEVFARQVTAWGRPGDVLVAFSTSGTSPNVLAAARAGRRAGVSVWALTGPGPNPLTALADEAVAVEAPTTATVQEIHLSLVHALCIALDDALGVQPPVVA